MHTRKGSSFTGVRVYHDTQLPESFRGLLYAVDTGSRVVRAFEFQPTMMHAKTVLVDDDVVAVGSLNLDALSLNKMEEASLIVQDKEVAATLAAQYEEDMKRSLEVKLPADGRKVQ